MKLLVCFLLFISTTASAFSSLRFPLGVSIETLDPTEAEDFVTIRILMNLGSGLVRADKNLKPLFQLAQSVTTSPDKKTYTFKLKKAFWSDGKQITSQDFIYAFKRTLSPITKAKISQNFQEIIVNAKDYKDSKLKDFNKVGIQAPDNNTLIFHLTHPAPYFLSLFTLPFTFPMRQGNEQIKVNTPTSGPYFVSEFKSASKIVLTPNPKYLKHAQNIVELKFIQESSTLVALYEKNEIDVLEKIPSSDYERFKNNPDLKSSSFLATYYLGFNITKKPFDDINFRKEIISNIDRQEISKILKDPQKISSSWVPTPLEGSQKKYEILKNPVHKTKNLSSIELVYDAQEKNNLIASLVQNQLKNNLKLPVQLKSMEWKSYIHYLSAERPSFFRFAWLAAFPDPLSHLNVFKSDNPNNYTGYKNKEYDHLVDQIAQTPYGKKRSGLIDKAQKILLQQDAIIMPLFHYVQYYLIKKEWSGLEVTPMGLLYFDKANLKRGHGTAL